MSDPYGDAIKAMRQLSIDELRAEIERLRAAYDKLCKGTPAFRASIIEECARVADMEPELEGDPTPEQVAVFTQTGDGDFARAVCRATKKSIAQAIRALKD